MGEVRTGKLRCVAPGTSGLIGDRNKILLPDGSGYDRRTDTVTVASNISFKIYIRGMFGFWKCIANIKNGNGTAQGTLVIKK